ncbi:hypothetical protein GCM10022255_086450 [Dactylosporangium darangshiense]|uniref:Transposase n=1 Tax=Dactylosporangium darangshiense TaxID=579108 RepID=A0ABP8DMU3_9ACTN
MGSLLITAAVDWHSGRPFVVMKTNSVALLGHSSTTTHHDLAAQKRTTAMISRDKTNRATDIAAADDDRARPITRHQTPRSRHTQLNQSSWVFIRPDLTNHWRPYRHDAVTQAEGVRP